MVSQIEFKGPCTSNSITFQVTNPLYNNNTFNLVITNNMLTHLGVTICFLLLSYLSYVFFVTINQSHIIMQTSIYASCKFNLLSKCFISYIFSHSSLSRRALLHILDSKLFSLATQKSPVSSSIITSMNKI